MSRLRPISRITGVRKINVMLSLKCHIWSTLALFVILVPSPAPAQTVVNSFEELRQVLKKGQTVIVTDASGQRTKGKVADVSPSSLVVRAEAMTRGKRIAIGAGIDALVNKGGNVLYASPRQTRSLMLSPVLGKDRQGVLVSVRF